MRSALPLQAQLLDVLMSHPEYALWFNLNPDAKRNQYQDLGIPEYWIVDPQEEEILVLELADDLYGDKVTLRGSDRVSSSQLGDLSMTAADIFTGNAAQSDTSTI